MANNLSDNVVLLDIASGKVLQRFDLSTSDLVPSSFPYTVRRHARWPPRLVQLVERIARRRAGSGQRQGRPLDQVAGT